MVYEYLCKKCHRRFEMTQSIKDDPLATCLLDNCDGKVHRVPQVVGIEFKGSGFYKTDNRKTEVQKYNLEQGLQSKGSGEQQKSSTEVSAKE